MALGTTKVSSNCKKAVCILSGAIATSVAPSAATDGVQMYPNEADRSIGYSIGYAGKVGRESVVFVKSTAGSGAMDVTIRLWGYLAGPDAWFPLGAGVDGTKGTINAGSAMGETGANSIAHCEPLYLAGHFDRLYAQVTGINGTSTAVDVWVTMAQSVGY